MKKIFILMIIIDISIPLFCADYTDFINEGQILLKQGKITESIKLFEKARDTKSSDPYAYYYLGEAFYAMGKKREAIDNYNKAIEIDNTNPDFHYSLAHLYISEGNYEEAIKLLDKVIELSPSSVTGKSAKRLKEEILIKQESKEMTQKWGKMEEELKKQKEVEEVKKTPTEGLPTEFMGMYPEMKVGPQEEKIPVEQLVKKIKFGTQTARQRASTILLTYEQLELSKVVTDMIDIIKQSDEPIVRKNVILAVGKTGAPEGIDTILKIIQDKNELYDIKITALDSIFNIRTENITTALRNTLKLMVENREKERTEAQKNIKDITTKLETLEVQKITLNMQIQQEEQKRNEIMQKLQMSDIPSEFGAPPGIGQPGGAKPLSMQEIQKIRTELLKVEESINKKRGDLTKTEQQITELQQQKGRYESLLRARTQKSADINVVRSPVPPQGIPYGPPGPEFGMPVVETPRYEETSEDKNEVIFALKLIRALGTMRDRQGISVIKKGWEEYGVESELIYYLLSLAQLGDFTGIQSLAERLRQDYPQAQLDAEITLRKSIIEVAGEYLTQRPDQKLQGLIEFLSEEGEYPEIKGAASSVLASLTKAPGK
ncbi:MAG: tetratricopeptide repeat protein [Candidatus Omnitrophica bacterium]|nr:tetratricopeptide repeat protein [Candidatus Omnitrophota bacterium]